jgi:phosphate transport system substrate-binding protein
MKVFSLFFCGFVILLAGCGELPENGPTYGQVKVVADETLFPVVDALELAFEHTYKNTDVQVTYLPEAQAMQQFFNDSIMVMVSARTLNAEEASFFAKKNINPRTALFANDAVALLVNPANPDTNLTCEQTLEIFKGKTLRWNQINPKNQSGAINLVFDNQASSTVRFVMEKAGIVTPPTNSYALKTTEAVVEYVAKNPGAIGLVGYSWLSDYDDPQCRKLRSQVEVVAISPCGKGKEEGFFEPFSSNVLEENYSYSRQIFIINQETSSGTGTGFSAFVAGEMGQRIISKTGILPAYVVEHKIELKSEPFRVKK